MKNSVNYLVLFLVLLPGVLYAEGQVNAESIVKSGNAKGAIACSACHGMSGEGNAAAGYPYLAGLSEQYITAQLNAIKTGSRTSPVMQNIAKALSDKDITALAKYYSIKDKPASDSQQNTKTTPAGSGRTIAENGKWQAGLPACFKCHGNMGQGIKPHFPPIAGQPYTYIRDQLLNWKQGKRKNDPVGLMQSVAGKLSNDEIEEVSRYLSRL